MTDFYASPGRLREAAGTADDVATALKGMHPARGLDRVSAAMPGAGAARTAEGVGQSLEQTTSAAARDTEGYADALRTAATTFQATDRQESCRVESITFAPHPVGLPTVPPPPGSSPFPIDVGSILLPPPATPQATPQPRPPLLPDAPTVGGR